MSGALATRNPREASLAWFGEREGGSHGLVDEWIMLWNSHIGTFKLQRSISCSLELSTSLEVFSSL